jgi:hypothetical protein
MKVLALTGPKKGQGVVRHRLDTHIVFVLTVKRTFYATAEEAALPMPEQAA